MFGHVFSFFTRRKRDRRARLSDTLLSRLDNDNYLAVDRPLLRSLGVNRRELFRAVYGLVIRERMHMLAEADGTVVLLTNAEYKRFMERRSAYYETRDERGAAHASVAAAPRAPEAPAAAAVAEADMDEESIAARQERLDGVAASILASDSESALFTGATLGGGTLDGLLTDAEASTAIPAIPAASAAESGAESEYDWFDLDIGTGGKLPEKRQTLPKRRRQPWLVAEGAGLEVE